MLWLRGEPLHLLCAHLLSPTATCVHSRDYWQLAQSMLLANRYSTYLLSIVVLDRIWNGLKQRRSRLSIVVGEKQKACQAIINGENTWLSYNLDKPRHRWDVAACETTQKGVWVHTTHLYFWVPAQSCRAGSRQMQGMKALLRWLETLFGFLMASSPMVRVRSSCEMIVFFRVIIDRL